VYSLRSSTTSDPERSEQIAGIKAKEDLVAKESAMKPVFSETDQQL
jgi:hypothetical protein